jgi:hypothetical protein
MFCLIVREELVYLSYGLGLCVLLIFVSIVINLIGMITKSLFKSSSRDLSEIRNDKIEKII